MASKQCQHLQELVHDSLAKHLYDSAVFFADKLVTLGGGSGVDVYTLAQAFFMNGQFRRAFTLLKKSDLVEQDPRCCYLAARCLAELRDWEQCLAMLGGWDDEEVLSKLDSQASTQAEAPGQEISLHAAMLLLRGKAYDALENQQRAARWYKAALQADPFCYEAFQALIENHMLTSIEEFKLVESLNLKPEHQWLQLLYRAKCKKYDQQSVMEATLEKLEAPVAMLPGSPEDTSMQDASTPPLETPSQTLGFQLAHAGLDSVSGVRTRGMAARSNASPATPALQMNEPGPAPPAQDSADSPISGCGLADNLYVLVCRADWLHYLGAYQECFHLTSSIIERDPNAIEAMPLHLAAAYELKKKNELFLCAHRLVEDYPERVVSWFAVACYYMCTRQFEVARRYFGKATSMEPTFAPAWIGFGHSFAFQDESDQAMAAYRTAARLFPGLHLPLLGMGMEYQRMNNLALAEQLFKQGHAICPADPLLCNELGVLAYRNNHYQEAEQWLNKALDRLPDNLTPAWEPTLLNLGHVYRKQQRWREAEETYLRALSLAPGQAATFAALGYTNHLQGKLQQAILYYHKGLGVRPEDAFAGDMLTVALREECELGATDV